MSEKKSVSAYQVVLSSFKDMRKDSFLFISFLFPIYLLIGIAFTYNDFIIVYNLDFEYYSYSRESYLIGLFYILFESYVFSIIAIAIHNHIIKNKITLIFFSKGLLFYFFIYLANHIEFIFHFLEKNISLSFAAPLIFLILGIFLILFFTYWLWALYLPNLAVKDNLSFMYIVKNSYGARLVVVLIPIYLVILCIIPAIIISVFISEYHVDIFLSPLFILLAVMGLSHTYLGWQELEANTKKSSVD